MLVSIDLKTLVGLSNNPGLVLGEGPLGVEASRRMARSAPWRLMVMDPTFKQLIDLGKAFEPAADILPPVTPKATTGPGDQSGSPGGHGPPDTDGPPGSLDQSLWPSKTLTSNSYCASQRIRDLVAVRDQRCIVPSCRQPAMMCDLDHVVPYDPEKPADQQTRAANLVPLCRHHHQLKTDGKWKHERDSATGIITIRTVAGQEFTVPPTSLVVGADNVENTS